MDLWGLELRVYGSPTFINDAGMNHAFVWSTELQQGKGMNGSMSSGGLLKSGGNRNGVGSLNSPYKIVDLQGKSEAEVFEKIRSWPGWNKTTWWPAGQNPGDCHAELANAFDYAGVKYPGAPNGRVDWNEAYNSQMANIGTWEQNISGSTVNPSVQDIYFNGGITASNVFNAASTLIFNTASLIIGAIQAEAAAQAAAFAAAACVGVETANGIIWLDNIVPAFIP